MVSGVLLESTKIRSTNLERDVVIDFYLPKNVENPNDIHLLLINDGQNMEELGLEPLLDSLYAENAIKPLLCAAIHAGVDRKVEYGTVCSVDYKGRGAKAKMYDAFILRELLPHIRETYMIETFETRGFCGFSLGGLCALDMVWNHPEKFSICGVFSGSLWWRSKSLLDKDYSDDKHRIMHEQIKKSAYQPGLRFFFQTGTLDEKMDRNKNGIIDSIDDTRDLISILTQKGYSIDDIHYMEINGGKHDIATWRKAMPEFLRWGFGVSREV